MLLRHLSGDRPCQSNALRGSESGQMLPLSHITVIQKRDLHVSLPFVFVPSSSFSLTFMAQLDYQERHQLVAHNSGINAIAFSPDGRRFVSASDDSTVLVWSTSFAVVLAQIKAHSPVISIAWLNNSNSFIFGCENGMLASVNVLEVCPDPDIKTHQRLC